jgi:hypothetical protein
MPKDSTFARCRHWVIRDIRTNISLHSIHSPGAVNFGYSDSGFQGAALTCHSGCLVQRLVEHLQLAQQAVSTLLTRPVVRELNFTVLTDEPSVKSTT